MMASVVGDSPIHNIVDVDLSYKALSSNQTIKTTKTTSATHTHTQNTHHAKRKMEKRWWRQDRADEALSVALAAVQDGEARRWLEADPLCAAHTLGERYCWALNQYHVMVPNIPNGAMVPFT